LHAIVFGWSVFTFNIVFLLQILGAGQGFLADRFTYIAYIGLNFILAYYLDKLLSTKWRTYALLSCAFLLAGYAYMTIYQNTVWKNSGTLWTHVLKYHTDTKLPYGNRANYYRDNGQLKKAMSDYNEAIRLGELSKDPKGLAQTYNSRARLYFDSSNTRDSLLLALKDYNKAIELKPGDGEFLTNRGATYARLGDLNRALQDLTEAIKVKPDHAVAFLNRSLIHKGQNNLGASLNDLVNYTKLRPYNADIWYEKSRLEVQMNQIQKALASVNRALQINANNGLYYEGRASIYLSLGNVTAARQDAQTAISLGRSIAPVLRAGVGI